MRLRLLHLVNFRRHRDTLLEWPAGVTAVLGQNGAGKSTLVEALTFALYGTDALRTNKEGCRASDAPPADPVTVRLEAEIGGQAVSIERTMRGKSLQAQATLSIDGTVIVPPGAGSAEAVTVQVSKLLGLDLAAFTTTVVAKQKDLARLLDLPPAERKRLLLSMVGVDKVDRAIDQARKQRNQAKARLEGMSELLADLDALRKNQADARARLQELTKVLKARTKEREEAAVALATAKGRAEAGEAVLLRVQALRAEDQALGRDLVAAKRRIEEAGRRREEAMQAAAALASLGDTAKAVAEAEAAHHEGERLAAALVAWEAEMAARAKAERESSDIQRRLATPLHAPAPLPSSDIPERRAALDAERRTAKESLAALEERLDHLEHLGSDTPCPVCQRPLEDGLPVVTEDTKREIEASRTRLEAVKAEEKRLEAAALERQHQEREAKVAIARFAEEQRARARDEARIALLAERLKDPPRRVTAPPLGPLKETLEGARRRHEQAIRFATLAAQEEAAAKEEGKARTDLDAIEARRRTLVWPTDEEVKAAEAAKQQLGAADAADRAAERALQAARQQVEATTTLEAEAKRAVQDELARREKVEALALTLRTWTALVGHQGGGILDGFRDHLVARLGPAVAREASGLMARFTDGRYSDVLLDESYDVLLRDGPTYYPLARFSGGEGDLVHLAVRLAVSRLLAEQRGVEARMLVLDEVFGSLDKQRRGLVVAALRGLATLYEQVIVVSHIEDLHDALDHALLVEDGGDGAKVTLHNG